MALDPVTRSHWPGNAPLIPARPQPDATEATGPAGAALAKPEDSAADQLTALGDILTALGEVKDAIEALQASNEAKSDAVLTALATANGHLAVIETNTTPP